jgi:P2-related tail formation protein
MEACGYVAVPNPRDKWDGRWNVGGKRQMIYASASLSVRDRFNAIKQRFGLS